MEGRLYACNVSIDISLSKVQRAVYAGKSRLASGLPMDDVMAMLLHTYRCRYDRCRLKYSTAWCVLARNRDRLDNFKRTYRELILKRDM